MDAVVDERVRVELDSVTVVNVHVVVVKVPDDMLDVMVIEIKLMVKLELARGLPAFRRSKHGSWASKQMFGCQG